MLPNTDVFTEVESGTEYTGKSIQIPYFAKKILKVSREPRTVIEDVTNEEKVKKIESGKRLNIFIIHGPEEIGDNSDEVKKVMIANI